MAGLDPANLLSANAFNAMRRRARIIQLLDAAERTGITPLSAARLHGFAYLADVLSPVWDLVPFDGKILKIEGGPHYPELQDELDYLVVVGLVGVTDLRYLKVSGGMRMDGRYTLRFDSTHLASILSAVGAGDDNSEPLDPHDRNVHSFLVDLAGALATVPEDEIEVAATVDATYADERIDMSNIVDFAIWEDSRKANLSVLATERFKVFLPHNASLSAGERIYLYASYLGRRINGR